MHLLGYALIFPAELDDVVYFLWSRVSLLEAYNSVYKYDLIAITETHLDTKVIDESKLRIDGYTFLKKNHAFGIKQGGVGLYMTDSLPVARRPELGILPECIVCDIQLNRRKYFFVVLYTSPSQSHANFENFADTFEKLVSLLSAENPYSMMITGDFNCRSSRWWENNIDNHEGKHLESTTSDIGLTQLINLPTRLRGESKSCINLTFTDQPNLFIESGVHQSLQGQCHHKSIYGILSVTNPVPPPYKRRLWFYDKVSTTAIRKSIEMYPWRNALGSITCLSQQVDILSEVLLNIFFNFIPNKVVTIKSKDVPWITGTIKSMIQKKNPAYNSFVKNGQSDCRLQGIQDLLNHTFKTIEDAKHRYFMELRNALSKSNSSNKRYWSLINKLLHKAKVPLIPPLLENAQILNDHVILQCSTIETGSEIPDDDGISDVLLLSNIFISDEQLLKVNPSNKCEQSSWVTWYLSENDKDMQQLSPIASENNF